MSIETTLIRDGGQELEGLWQFDLGQTFTVLTGEVDVDLTDCEIQWVYGTLEPPNYTDNRPFTAISGVALTFGGLCEIPDSALEQSGEVKGYIVYKDGSTVLETLGMVYFTPETRARPADYVSPDNTVTLTVLIDARIALALPEAVESEVESQLPGAIAEADLVPYTGATKAVDLNYQDLTGLKNIKSANGGINEEESGQFAFGGQVNTSAAHAFAMGDELSNSQIASAIFGFGGTMPINGRFAVAAGTQKPTYVEQKIGFLVDKNGNTYVGNMNHLGAGGFNLALFSLVDGVVYYDGEPFSGVNVAKYATVDELDTNEDLIIAQVTTTQESWRSARRKQDATFTFVEVPKMPISDFTASAYKDGVFYADLEFETNKLGLSEEGIGSFTVMVPNSEMAGTIYVYIEHTATVTALDIEITFGWNRVTYTVVDGELVFGTIAHFPDANFTSLPEFTELIINATNGALTGLQEFITTDTANNEKTGLRWIREEGIYIVNTDGDWRKYTSSYIADDYNRLPDDAPIGSTAITLADVEQDKEPEQFETEVIYDNWYFRRDPVIPEIDILAIFDFGIYGNVSSSGYLYAGGTGLSNIGGTEGFYIVNTENWNYIIYTVEGFTAEFPDNGNETIALSAGWNGVRADFADDVWTLTDLNLTFETLPILSDCYIEAGLNPVFADYLDGFFSTTPYITRKAGGYTKLESGWQETVCIDPLVEVKANKVTTIDANSTDDEYPSAKAVYEFAPDMSGYLTGTYPISPTGTEFLNGEGDFVEIEIPETVSTMTEYATALTLNNANYWTTTGSIAFALPTAVSGKENTFKLFVKVTDAGHAVTFTPSGSQRLGSVAHTFGVGTHLVEGVYNPIDSKWLLGCSAVGVPA